MAECVLNLVRGPLCGFYEAPRPEHSGAVAICFRAKSSASSVMKSRRFMCAPLGEITPYHMGLCCASQQIWVPMAASGPKPEVLFNNHTSAFISSGHGTALAQVREVPGPYSCSAASKSSYSICSSAINNRLKGTSMSSARAVVRLMLRMNLVGN